MTKKIGIIGGGIVGATAAFYLSKEKQHVTILDDGVGQATSAAAGIISPWLSQRRNKEWYFLAKEGAKFYSELIKDLEKITSTQAVYQKTGTILYKKDEKLLLKLKKLAEQRKIEAPEIGDISLLTAGELRHLIPNISHEESALFISGGAKIDGALLIKLLIDATMNERNSFIQTKIRNISYEDNAWYVSDQEKTYQFDELILACGAWIGELLVPLNYSVDIRPQKGQLIELHTSLETNNWPVMMPVGETDIIPFNNGNILIGATHENDEGFDLKPNPLILSSLKKDAEEFIFGLDTVDISTVRVGTRAYTSDFSPFFGEISSLPHLLVASGLGSSGLTTGPIIGKTLADWVMNQTTDFEAYRHKPNQYIFKNE